MALAEVAGACFKARFYRLAHNTGGRHLRMPPAFVQLEQAGGETARSMSRASNRKPGCKPMPAPLDEWWLYATLHAEHG
jgi:hypothetical protein